MPRWSVLVLDERFEVEARDIDSARSVAMARAIRIRGWALGEVFTGTPLNAIRQLVALTRASSAGRGWRKGGICRS